MTILGPNTAVPTLAAAIMQRWAVILQAYNYHVKYQLSKEYGSANARLSCDHPPLKEEAETFFLYGLNELSIDAKDIHVSRETKRDPVLPRVSN